MADARLLIEKFKAKKRNDELLVHLSNLRSGKNGKRKKIDEVTIEFCWQHFNEKKKKYCTVSVSNSGGLRKKQFSRKSTINDVFSEAKNLYFPNGSNSKMGLISLMITSLTGPDLNTIDLSTTIEDYIAKTSFKSLKVYLRTKKWKVGGEPLPRPLTMTSDSDSDFLPCYSSYSKIPREQSTPISNDDIKEEKSSKEFAKDKSTAISTFGELIEEMSFCSSNTVFPASEIVSTPAFEKKNEKTSSSMLIKQQNSEFEQSLRTDQEKERCRRAETRRIEILKKRQEQHVRLIPSEPSLSEDAIVVVLMHPILGRTQRLFPSNITMVGVYHWAGSLLPEPEFFHLTIGGPVNSTLLDPDESIAKCEREIVFMKAVSTSDFTMDIIFNNQTFENNEVPVAQLPLQVAKSVSCPVCLQYFDVNDIEMHASQCADDKYPLILIEDEDSLGNVENKDLASTNSIQEPLELFSLDKLKTLISECKIKEDTAIKLRVKRGCEFDSFLSKFQQKWVREKIGYNLIVQFVGEAGIDQGGPKREFFSGISALMLC